MQMYNSRCYSAPPVDKFIIDEDIELENIHHDLNTPKEYRKFNYKINSHPHIYDIHTPYWKSDNNDFISQAFSEKKTMVELIDMDNPGSEMCIVHSGITRTTTPVGDKPVVNSDMLSQPNNTIFIPIKMSSLSPKSEDNPIINDIKAFYDAMNADTIYDAKQMSIAVCKDQEGSRFIQNKIDQWESEQISFFFTQIQSSLLELSMNLFGNYVIQKIIPYLNKEESFKLILQLFGHVYNLSLHMYGCRVIQKLIENLDDIKFIISELESHIMDLIASPNGNHVIQKCIDKNVEKTFLLKEIEANCINLAQQRYGCRVLQRLFEVSTEEDVNSIYQIIIDNISVLINDKYGNYVIQHLIQSPNKKRYLIYSYIIKNSFELSKYKFSSNVIEKCVNNATKDQLEGFLAQFLLIKEGTKPNLFYMCTDMYANYVVQRFFDIASADIKHKAKIAVKPYIKEMKAVPFTKHILTRLF